MSHLTSHQGTLISILVALRQETILPSFQRFAIWTGVRPLLETMYTFGRIENVESLFNKVGVLEIAITRELDAQNTDAARSVAEIQAAIDASEEENAHYSDIGAAMHAEREKRVVDVRETGWARLEELRRELADAKHELAVITSPVLLLPCEITAEVFDWHMLMGGSLTILLLVCKRWTAVAYSSPRLWSRITVTYRPHYPLRLRGAIRCSDLNHLRSVLSRSQSCPLHVELAFDEHPFPLGRDYRVPPPSFLHVEQGSANRIEAIKLMLDNQSLIRCVSLALNNYYLPVELRGLLVPAENMITLSLLSSLWIGKASLESCGKSFI